MYPIPDFSYFSIPGFIETIRSRQVKNYSLILHDGKNESWDKTLSEDNKHIYNSLHSLSGENHDIFLPHTASNNFIEYNKDFLCEFLKPAILNIKSFLKKNGFKNTDSYMENDDYWLKYLYANKENHYNACKFMAQKIGIEDNLPVLLVWENIDDSSLLVIHPKVNDENLEEYIKNIYKAIINASIKNNSGIIDLRNNILKEMDKNKFKNIYKKSLNLRIADLLKRVGKFYSNRFDEAINNFKNEIKNCKEKHNINDIYEIRDYKKREIEYFLRKYNFTKVREGSNHEIWYNKKLKIKTVLPRHPKITPSVASSIRKTIFNKVVNSF